MGVNGDKKYLYPILTIGTFAAACGATLIKLTDAPALIITTYRMIFASLFLIPFVIMKNPKTILNLGRRDVVFSILSGILLAVHFGTWTVALEHISVPPAILLVNVHPVFVVILSFFLLKERFRRREILGIIVTMLGMAVIVFPSTGNSLSLFGSIMALMGAASFGGYLMVGRRLRQKLSLLTYIFLVYSIAAVSLLATCAATGSPLLGYNSGTYLMMLAIGIISTVISHSSINWSIKYLKTTIVSVVTVATPIFGSLIAWLVLSDVPTLWAFIGGALVIAGIYLVGRVSSNGKGT